MKTDELTKTTGTTSGEMKTDSTSELSAKSPSESKPVRHRRKSPEKDIEKPKTEKVETESPVDEDESWKQDKKWLFVASSSRLLPHSRKVRGGYSGKMYDIRPNGIWVWRPDADEILKLQGLAACRGGPVARPFGVANPNAIMERYEPTEPPQLD